MRLVRINTHLELTYHPYCEVVEVFSAADVLVEDKLFATLDTRSRRLRFPREREVVITDTVGFIRDLPKELFAAFRATFEEARDADLLLHVIDVTDPAHEEHIKTTEHLLEELDLTDLPLLRVFNKADALPPGEAASVAGRQPGALAVSALDHQSLKPLLERMELKLFAARGTGAGIVGPPEEMEASVRWDVVAED